MLQEKIINKAHQLGFNLVGFAPYQKLELEYKRLEKWIENSYQGGMEYMERNKEKRLDVKNILSDCKSVISLGMNYFVNDSYPESKDSGKVSRYAWGKDYHIIIWEKLAELISYIEEIKPNFRAKSYVDTGPIMDKAWAVKAGIGWQGKHSNVINREFGSWFFIANILTNYDFDSYNNRVLDYCGNCTACIDACPTNAIVEDYVVDSNKCISYLTIENKNEISDKFVGKFEDWIFGCDICQEVCPWNKKFAQKSLITEFLKGSNKTINFIEAEQFTNSKFKKKYNGSPILRARAKGIKRNAKFLKKNETK